MLISNLYHKVILKNDPKQVIDKFVPVCEC
jgi:hypothetical protein